MTTNIFDMTDTWNNAGQVFTAIKMNVNNAGSAVGSKIIDLQVGGASKWSIDPNGVATLRGQLMVGVAGGNYALLQGSAAGQAGVILGVDPSSADPAVNVHIVPKGAAGVNLYSNNSLQLSIAGPPGTTHYIQATGSISGNPVIAAGGGGRVEITDLNMTGNPTAPSPQPSSDGDFVATTHFVKQFKYVQTAPPTTFNQLAAFADPPDGTLLQGVNMPAAGLKKVGPDLVLSDDLGALEALTGTNTIYYRAGVNTWNGVVIGPSLSFTGGTLDVVAGGGVLAPAEAEYIVKSAHGALSAERVLTDSATITWDFSVPGQVSAISAAGGGNVSTSGAITVGNYARWAGATSIEARTPTQVRSDIAAQPVDPTLSALAGLSTLADQIIYSTGADAFGMTSFTPVARNFAAQTTTAGQLASMGGAPLDNPQFTTAASLAAPAIPAGSDSSGRIPSTSWVKGLGYQTATDVTAAITAQAQPLDPDLTAIAALTGTNTIYYRSAANTWSAVTIGANMTFSGGVLNSTATGSGNVSNSGTPNVNELAQWTDATHVKGLPIATHRTNAKFTGTIELANTGDLTTTNGWRIQGAASGGNPTISAQGVDADVGFFFSSKGNGGIFFYNANFGRPCLQLGSAPGSTAWLSEVAMPGYAILATNGVVNAPIEVQSDAFRVLNSASQFSLLTSVPGGTQIRGCNDASVATTGFVGEFGTPNTFTNVTVAANTAQILASINGLTAGDWDVWVVGYGGNAGSAQTNFNMGLNDVAITLPTPGAIFQTVPVGMTLSFTCYARFNKSSTFNAYLNVNTGSTAGVQFNGTIYARRRR